VFAEQPPEAEIVLRAHARGPYTLTRDWPIKDLTVDAHGSRFKMRDLEIVCPLPGEHQVENARTAAIALHQLGASPAGIAATRWPGRLERISDQPEIILDGAHNPSGTRALVQYIRRFYSGRRIWIVYGVMRDKSVDEMASLMFPLAERVIVTAPANSRAMPPESIPAPHATVTQTVREAVDLLRNADPAVIIFITGSLFVVGEARALLVQ